MEPVGVPEYDGKAGESECLTGRNTQNIRKRLSMPTGMDDAEYVGNR